MGVTNISFMGQSNGTGAYDTNRTNQEALFLKVFSGEVLQAFETATVMKPLHTVRTISSGKSAQFPLTGIAQARYHTPGTDLLTEQNAASQDYVYPIKHAEKTITIDELLTATTFIDKLDEAKNHYDVRSIYSTELGRSLAYAMDKNLIGVGLNTAATYVAGTGNTAAIAGPIEGHSSSTVITDNALGTQGQPDIDADTGVAAFVDLMYDAAARMDEKNVPSDERYVLVTPASYYRIVNSDIGKELINRDYNPNPSDSFVNAQIASVAGFRIIRSNHASSIFGTNVNSGTMAPSNSMSNNYGGNFTHVKALFFQRQAFGTVKLLDLSMESEYEIRLQGHLMVAKYAMGHGSLRHECAGVLAETA